MLSSQALNAYFERIDYRGSHEANPENLRALVAGHVFHIPFENLDIHMGRKIALDADCWMRKLVEERRGGYCYEMNGLFALVLETLGYRVDRLMGRILFGVTEIRPRSHQLSLVHLDNQAWVVDVGYGGWTLAAPLLLEADSSETRFSERYRIMQENSDWYAVQVHSEAGWNSLYSFSLEKHLPVDYAFANYFNSTSPDSKFVQQRICALPRPDGRVAMVNNKLKIVKDGQVTESEIENAKAYQMALETHFGIMLEAGALGWPY